MGAARVATARRAALNTVAVAGMAIDSTTLCMKAWWPGAVALLLTAALHHVLNAMKITRIEVVVAVNCANAGLSVGVAGAGVAGGGAGYGVAWNQQRRREAVASTRAVVCCGVGTGHEIKAANVALPLAQAEAENGVPAWHAQLAACAAGKRALQKLLVLHCDYAPPEAPQCPEWQVCAGCGGLLLRRSCCCTSGTHASMPWMCN